MLWIIITPTDVIPIREIGPVRTREYASLVALQGTRDTIPCIRDGNSMEQRVRSVPDELREQYVLTDGFATYLKQWGWTLTDHRPIHTD